MAMLSVCSDDNVRRQGSGHLQRQGTKEIRGESQGKENVDHRAAASRRLAPGQASGELRVRRGEESACVGRKAAIPRRKRFLPATITARANQKRDTPLKPFIGRRMACGDESTSARNNITHADSIVARATRKIRFYLGFSHPFSFSSSSDSSCVGRKATTSQRHFQNDFYSLGQMTWCIRMGFAPHATTTLSVCGTSSPFAHQLHHYVAVSFDILPSSSLRFK